MQLDKLYWKSFIESKGSNPRGFKTKINEKTITTITMCAFDWVGARL